MRIIDTHLHVIDRGRLSYPWLGEVPALDADFLYETFAAEARRIGITDVLHMEVDVAEHHIEAEIDHVADIMARPGSLMRGGIIGCRPESPDFPAFLDRVLPRPEVKGLRRVLHTMPDALSESALFRANIARLAGTGKVVDLCMLPRQIGQAIALADHAPDVTFVLDHCGVPAIRDGALDPWRAGIAEIARRPNVNAKISGVVAYADPAGWTVDDLRPYVEHVIGAFGWNRVVWGSDWPVVTLGGPLSTWLAATQAIVAGASLDERAGLFHLNAERLWQLSP